MALIAGMVAFAHLTLAPVASAAEPEAPAAPPPPPRNSPPAPKSFGESHTLRQCLVFTAKSVRDNQSDLDNQDWVVLSVENRCGVPVVNLQAELILQDTRGQFYGTAFWVVGQGERLNAGLTWEDTLPVPDPNQRVPHAWTVRILRAETPILRRAPKPPVTRDAR